MVGASSLEVGQGQREAVVGVLLLVLDDELHVSMERSEALGVL